MKIENEGIRAMLDPEYLLEEVKQNKKAKAKSFSLNAFDIEIIESIQTELAKKMIHVSDSEVIRVALRSISKLTSDQFLSEYKELERRPAGRPSGK